MARGKDVVPLEAAARLKASAALLQAAEREATMARRRLGRQLAKEQAHGSYSVRALAEASSLTPKQVRLLLRAPG